MTLLIRLGLIVLALAGCVISAVLMQLSVPSDRAPMIFGAEVCTPTGTVDCNYVLSSRWAKVGTVPTAALGFAYFAVIATWFTIIGPPNYLGRRWHLLPLLCVSVGVCASVCFMSVMAFGLPVWCTWCIAAHGVNALIFVLVVLARPRRLVGSDRSIDTQVPHPSGTRVAAVAGTCAALVLLIIVGGNAYRAHWIGRQWQWRYIAVTNNIDYIEWRHRQAPVQEIPVRPDDPSLGSAEAPFTIVMFGDFMCPKCREFYLSAEGLLQRFPGKLRFVFKHYPLATACNPYTPRNLHHYSCEAALAAEAAHAVGNAQQSHDYHRALYNHMRDFDQRPYEALAAEIGIDSAKLASVMQTRSNRDRLKDDIALAHELGVEVTPTTFLNGRRLSAWKIVNVDAAGKLDVKRTVALWERLLGEPAKRGEDEASP